MHWSTMHWSTMHWSTMHWSTMHRSPVTGSQMASYGLSWLGASVKHWTNRSMTSSIPSRTSSTTCRSLHVSSSRAWDSSYTSSSLRRRQCSATHSSSLHSQPCRTVPRVSRFGRYFATSTTESAPHYAAVVVGAGPAGVTCVGNLLERKIEPILWVDPEFSGGRVNKMYREVPSNTKVTMFVQFAEALTPFRKIVSGVPSRARWEEPAESDGVAMNRQDKLKFMRELDQDKGCTLGLAADMILMLTEGLKRAPGVYAQSGRASKAVLDESTNQWGLSLSSSTGSMMNVHTDRLILCTGSSPTESELPVSGIPHLNLDDALSPTRLAQQLAHPGPTTVSVIGASHSAILVLRNLYNLASTDKPNLHIKWFTRHELRYAEYMDGWILRDNTGLKGEVADWAKQHLEPDRFPHSPVSKHVEVVSYAKGHEDETFRRELPGTDFVVQAIGYTRDPIPVLSTSSGKEIRPQFDHRSGAFTYTIDDSTVASSSSPAKLPGVYGAGIAWPERVTDPQGNVEHAVGFFKFMKFVKRVSPEWN